METLESLKDHLDSIVEDSTLGDEYAIWINDAIKQASNMYPWDVLRRTKTYTLTTSDSGIIKQPPVMQKLNRIVKANSAATGVEDQAFERKAVVPTNLDNRIRQPWYLTTGVTRSIGATYDVTATKGVATITQASTETTWPTDPTDIGKQVRIEGTRSVHDLLTITTGVTDTLTIDPPYSGISITSGSIEMTVDPLGQLQYELHDEKDALYVGDVVVEYQQWHPMLVNDDDYLLLPCHETIKLLALQTANRMLKYDVDASRLERDLERAMRLEIAPEGEENIRNLPSGLGGSPPSFAVVSRERSGRVVFKQDRVS